MVLKEGLIIWIDSKESLYCDLSSYEGNVICSERLRWCMCRGYLGEKELFVSGIDE